MLRLENLVIVFYLTQAAHAIPQILSSPISVSVVSASSIFRTASTASSSLTSVSAPSNTVTTVVASPTAPLSAVLPSQVSLPPHQAWCPSEIFCAGAVRLRSCKRHLTSIPLPVASADRQYCWPLFRSQDVCG